MQNQALNSRIIHHATEKTVQSNTQFAMNLSLWLVAVDRVAASN